MMFLTFALCVPASLVVRHEKKTSGSCGALLGNKDRCEQNEKCCLDSEKTGPACIKASSPCTNHDKTGDPPKDWCCCTDISPSPKHICVSEGQYWGVVEQVSHSDGAASPIIKDTIHSSCSNQTGAPTKCTCPVDLLSCVPPECAECRRVPEPNEEVGFHLKQKKLGDGVAAYMIPDDEWKAAGYKPEKYYGKEEWKKKHVSITVGGLKYIYVDASKSEDHSGDDDTILKKMYEGVKGATGIAGKTYCVEWETSAHFTDSDWKQVKASQWDHEKRPCSEHRKCLKYITAEDACGSAFKLNGGEEKSGDTNLKFHGTLYELVGKQGQCESEDHSGDDDALKKKIVDGVVGLSTYEGRKSVKKTVMAGLGMSQGSKCPKGKFHRGALNRQYKFCDCTASDAICK